MNNLYQFINDPEDANINFALAEEYYSTKHYASALSFYLRAAERYNSIELQYLSLIKASNCYLVQGSRNFTVRGLLQQAISILPNKAEAYYLLSKTCAATQHWEGAWVDAYMFASIAVAMHSSTDETPLEDLLYQKAVAGWNSGKPSESLSIFKQLFYSDGSYRDLAKQHIETITQKPVVPFHEYTGDQHKNLKIKFKDSELINRNYSESLQDLFVLTCTNGKKDGTYLEIGSGHPTYGNNTYLLEQLGWSGISIDINLEAKKLHEEHRKHTMVCEDATAIDYYSLLKEYSYIDYLQIDCDPPEVSFRVLLSLPLDKVEFGVITFEHDYYSDDRFRDRARKYLELYGYVLVAGNIAPSDDKPYEDWFVHPKLLSDRLIINTTSTCLPAKRYML